MTMKFKRKPYAIGRARVITVPPKWTTTQKKHVWLVIDRIGLILPEDLSLEEIRDDAAKIIQSLKGSPPWAGKAKTKEVEKEA